MLLVACSAPPPSSVDSDARLPDAPDARYERPDLGLADAQAVPPRPEAGVVDAGVPDAVTVDAGLPPQLRVTARYVPNKPLQAMLQVESNVPVRLEATINGPGVRDRVVETSVFAIASSLPMLALRADSTYLVEVRGVTEYRGVATAFEAIDTGSQGDIGPAVRVATNTLSEADDALLLFGEDRSGGTQYYAVDREGYVVWYYDVPGLNSQAPIIRSEGEGRLSVVFQKEVRLINGWGDTLRTYSIPDAYKMHHDAIILPNDNLLFLAYETRTIDIPRFGGPTSVTGDVIVEIEPSGRVLAEYPLLDLLDPTRFPGFNSLLMVRDGLDWSHSNAAWYDPSDNTFLVSVRNQSWVVKISRSSGELVWRLGRGGDFALRGGEWFFNQHAPSRSPQGGGALVLYDNGNERPEPASRGVRYSLDEREMTARQTWSWWTPFYTSAVGDIDDLADDGFLVAAGIAAPPAVPTVFEVTADGEEVWSLEAPGRFIYRAERIQASELW